MGVKVYGVARSTCTTRVLVCLEEKGVDYELVPVNMAAGAHKQQSFLSLNPFGQIPAFEDGDLKLFESRAISKYVAHRYKDIGTDLLGTSPAEMYSVGVWLEAEAHQFNPAIQPMVYELLVKPSRGGTPDATLVEAQAAKLGKVLDVYEEVLAKRKYLAGDVFSLADLHHLPCAHYIMLTPYASLIASRKHVNAWWEDISSRPAWKKPFGKIPALFESRAVTDHIASKYKEKGTDLLGPELGGIAIVGLWMEAEAHQFDAPGSVLIYQSIIKPGFGKAPDQALVRAQCEKLNKVFDAYEERLSKCKYMAGDYFSLADLHHLPCHGFAALRPRYVAHACQYLVGGHIVAPHLEEGL